MDKSQDGKITFVELNSLPEKVSLPLFKTWLNILWQLFNMPTID